MQIDKLEELHLLPMPTCGIIKLLHHLLIDDVKKIERGLVRPNGPCPRHASCVTCQHLLLGTRLDAQTVQVDDQLLAVFGRNVGDSNCQMFRSARGDDSILQF